MTLQLQSETATDCSYRKRKGPFFAHLFFIHLGNSLQLDVEETVQIFLVSPLKVHKDENFFAPIWNFLLFCTILILFCLA